MVRSLLSLLGLPLALLCAAVRAQAPEVTLDAPPSASARLEVAPRLAAEIARWREDARAAEHGEGVPVDRKRAAELYCRAARHGDAEAQYDLAWMLERAMLWTFSAVGEVTTTANSSPPRRQSRAPRAGTRM